MLKCRYLMSVAPNCCWNQTLPSSITCNLSKLCILTIVYHSLWRQRTLSPNCKWLYNYEMEVMTFISTYNVIWGIKLKNTCKSLITRNIQSKYSVISDEALVIIILLDCFRLSLWCSVSKWQCLRYSFLLNRHVYHKCLHLLLTLPRFPNVSQSDVKAE